MQDCMLRVGTLGREELKARVRGRMSRQGVGGALGECRLTEDPPLTNEERSIYRGGGEALWRLEGKETPLKGSSVSWGEPSLKICHSYLSWLDITS